MTQDVDTRWESGSLRRISHATPHTLGVMFVSLGEGIDCTTPAGKLQLHILAALAEFERERIRERVMAGLQRARAQGQQLGRPRIRPARSDVPGGSVRAAAKAWGVWKTTAARWINQGTLTPADRLELQTS